MQIQEYHGLDVAIIVVLFVGAILGAKRGIFRQTVRILIFVAAFAVAMRIHPSIEEVLRTQLHMIEQQVSRLHSFLAAFLAAYVVLLGGTQLLGKMLRSLSRRPEEGAVEALGLKPLDRLLGAGVGMVAAALVVGASLLALGSVSDPEFQKAIAGSKLRPILADRMRTVLDAVPISCREDCLLALRRLESAAQAVAVDLTAEKMSSATLGMNRLTKGFNNTEKTPLLQSQSQTGTMPSEVSLPELSEPGLYGEFEFPGAER